MGKATGASGERPVPRLLERGSWGLLIALLSLVAVAAFRLERTPEGFLIGDEATYLMTAESLAWDFDLRYSVEDHARFAHTWPDPPDLILLSPDDGVHLSYGKPFYYSLFLAPFVRLAPVRGAPIANSLLLVLASLAAAAALNRRWSPLGPIVVAVFVFCSVTFSHVFWIHADLFLMTATAIALFVGLVPAQEKSERRARVGRSGFFRGRIPGFLLDVGAGRWLLVGCLVAILGSSRPFYFVVLLPLLVVGARSARARTTLLVCTLGCVLILALTQFLATGAWTAYGAERRGFTPETGYPYADFPAEDWPSHIERLGDFTWMKAGAVTPQLDTALFASNGLYFLIGKNVGLLPYFLPLFLPLVLGFRRPGRWSFLAAVAIAIVGFLLLRPFNFYGGEGSLANRYFFPLYPMFWFLPSRRPHPATLAVTAVVAGLFLHPIWIEPGAPKIRWTAPSGHLEYRYMGGLGQQVLPHEASQRYLRAVGVGDVVYNGAWLRFLDHRVVHRPGNEFLELRGSGSILLGFTRRPRGLRIAVPEDGSETEARHRFASASISPGESTDLSLGMPSAHHRMWWPASERYLYRVRLQSNAESTPLTLRPIF